MNNTQDLKQVLQKKQEILQGNAERVAKQRAQGKLTARERVAKLVDQGSFVEMDVLVSEKDGGAGVVTGYGHGTGSSRVFVCPGFYCPRRRNGTCAGKENPEGA